MLTDIGNRNALGMAVVGGLNDVVFMQFDSEVGFQGASLTKEIAGDPDWWELFKKWLSSDSGVDDLPWWRQLACGAVCVDAIFGTHNPWSTSTCIHCLGADLLACVPAPSPIG